MAQLNTSRAAWQSPTQSYTFPSSSIDISNADAIEYVLVVGETVDAHNTLRYIVSWQPDGRSEVLGDQIFSRIPSEYLPFLQVRGNTSAQVKAAARQQWYEAPIAVPLKPKTQSGKIALGSLALLSPSERYLGMSREQYCLLLGFYHHEQRWKVLWTESLCTINTQVFVYDGSVYNIMPQTYYKVFESQTQRTVNVRQRIFLGPGPEDWVQLYTIPVAAPLSNVTYVQKPFIIPPGGFYGQLPGNQSSSEVPPESRGIQARSAPRDASTLPLSIVVNHVYLLSISQLLPSPPTGVIKIKYKALLRQKVKHKKKGENRSAQLVTSYYIEPEPHMGIVYLLPREFFRPAQAQLMGNQRGKKSKTREVRGTFNTLSRDRYWGDGKRNGKKEHMVRALNPEGVQMRYSPDTGLVFVRPI